MTILIIIAVIVFIVSSLFFIPSKQSKLQTTDEIQNSEISTENKDVSNISQKNNRRLKSGKFQVTGHRYLPDDVKRLVWKGIKEGDELYLLPDPENEYDEKAIKVMFQGNLIGWVPKAYTRKSELFNLLIQDEFVADCICIQNYRGQDYVSNGGGGMGDYMGMAQFVTVEFKMVPKEDFYNR